MSDICICLYQSRVPGTFIPLCAAQCERMFNTTRTPGAETGNTTTTDTHSVTATVFLIQCTLNSAL